ncbi:hypothetical protein RIVM261_022180 [Rivularia sp. IAM M-261]|nr:hypothetical protein RIVM261_022180 [Rivularia sp. IAM M-261]
MTIPNKNTENYTTTVTLTNSVDEILAEYANMSSEQIRSVTLDNVVVSTHAHDLYLPADIITELGLTLAEEFEFETATGIKTVRIFKDLDLDLTLQGRDTACRCIELPKGERAILDRTTLLAFGVRFEI